MPDAEPAGSLFPPEVVEFQPRTDVTSSVFIEDDVKFVMLEGQPKGKPSLALKCHARLSPIVLHFSNTDQVIRLYQEIKEFLDA